MTIDIRNSASKEANEIALLLKRSIREICSPDYGNDETIMNAWVENKTEENIKTWIHSENTFAVTGYLESEIVGFGLSSIKGEILLLYVSPEHKGKGVGALIYLSMEKQLKNLKVSRIVAYSTITAKNFYQKMGFTQFGKPIKVGSIDGEFPLEKTIVI